MSREVVPEPTGCLLLVIGFLCSVFARCPYRPVEHGDNGEPLRNGSNVRCTRAAEAISKPLFGRGS